MKREQETDERLMEQVAGGCRDCLELIVRRYANPLLTFIQRMVGDRHRSEELFKEVFLSVWLKRKQYQPPRPFRATAGRDGVVPVPPHPSTRRPVMN